MTPEDQIDQLKFNPAGEFTQSYLGFIRKLRLDWAAESDDELIARAVAKLEAQLASQGA